MGWDGLDGMGWPTMRPNHCSPVTLAHRMLDSVRFRVSLLVTLLVVDVWGSGLGFGVRVRVRVRG